MTYSILQVDCSSGPVEGTENTCVVLVIGNKPMGWFLKKVQEKNTGAQTKAKPMEAKNKNKNMESGKEP